MTVSKMKMFGSFQKLVSLLFSQNSQDITLKPNAAAYTVASVVSLPAVDGNCVLLSVGEAASNYQPLDSSLSAIAVLGAGIVVGDGAGSAVARSVVAEANKGLSVSNGDGVSGNPSLSLSIANLVSETAALGDKLIFGDVSASDAPKYLLISDLTNLIGPGAYGYSETWLLGTSVTITHSLDSKDVMVQIYDVATGDTILIDQISRPTVNTIDLVASEAPTAVTGWRVLVQKIA